MQKMIKHNDYVGKTEEKGTEIAKQKGFVVRITQRDGKSFLLDNDVNQNRMNFTISHGIIRTVEGG